jgi:hypothetical protein
LQFLSLIYELIALRCSPSGHFHILILSDPADAKVISSWWLTNALIPFLCYVSVFKVLPVLISQNFIILSCEPVITWGSSEWQIIDSTVWECPERIWTDAFVRMSHILAVESLPPVTIKSKLGWIYKAYTALKCPWYYLTTLFYSKSQHFTVLSSPHENKYGCLSLIANALTVFTCPVRVSFKVPLDKSQHLMVLSDEPVTKY